MTTYEEDVVDIYYNLKNFFTMKNIAFSAIEKRKGGKGRGEMDLLAIKVNKGRFDEAILGCSRTGKKRMKELSAEVISIDRRENKIFLTLKFSEKVLDIILFPFEEMLKEIAVLFYEKKLLYTNFQDPRYRALQYYVKKEI